MTLRTMRASTMLPALALTLAPAVLPSAASAAAPGTTLQLRDTIIGSGASVVAVGRVAGAGPGRQVLLQHAGTDGVYRTVAAGTTTRGGRYRVAGAVATSGRVRVAPRTAAAASGAASAPAYVTVVARALVRQRRASVLAGRSARFAGVVAPRQAGIAVQLQRRSGTRWITVDTTRTAVGGRFVVTHTVGSVGTRDMRLRVRDTPAGIASGRRSLGAVGAYRRALASWYGPGLYGNKLGCGGRLSPGTIGVAHKGLPCGTKLTLRVGSRTVAARVIDRGPYVGNREFDLTQATKDRLGFSGVGTIWVAPRR